MTIALTAGFLFSLSLILAIGAQNAFVLQQGIANRHLFMVCAICALSDALLIQIGVFGMNAVKTAVPLFADVMRYGGALFLCIYGILRFRAFCKGGEALQIDSAAIPSRKKTALTTLAMTWLNPHVYLDTVLLLGSVAAQYDPYRETFAIGAALASLLFFFSLGYGARMLRPWLARPAVWRTIELLIGIFMLYLAVSLVLRK